MIKEQRNLAPRELDYDTRRSISFSGYDMGHLEVESWPKSSSMNVKSIYVGYRTKIEMPLIY